MDNEIGRLSDPGLLILASLAGGEKHGYGILEDIIGFSHVMEAVEQLRGTATNQVAGAEVALVTGGPAPIPVSGLVLTK